MKLAGCGILGAIPRVGLLFFYVLISTFCVAQDDETPPPAKPSRGAVKLQFLPPPMDGTFSLGIYDAKGKLVRTLMRAAKAEAFTAALDGFITSWDGKNDAGEAMPAGKYSARGFCVGDKVQCRRADLTGQPSPDPSASPAPPSADTSPQPSASPVSSEKNTAVSDPLTSLREQLKMPDGKPFVPEEKMKLKLRLNPLTQEKSAVAEVAVGSDEKGSFVKLADGLELKRISETPQLKWVAAARGAEPGSLVVFQSAGMAVEEFVVSKLANMMAFDCGDFDYEPAK